MSLKDKISSIKPREKSGSLSASRVDFQKDWSLCKLIEIHRGGQEYVILFDWHDDLAVIYSESNPQSIEFYQVKGKKSGNWTLQDLLRGKKGKDESILLSIMGKMYDCKIKFEKETVSLNFVSNARFQAGLESKKSSLPNDNLCLAELSSKNKAKVKQRLKKEHGDGCEPELELIFLRVIDLSLNDSATHTQGKIVDFLRELYPDGKFNIASVYRMLFDEIKRRAANDKDITTYDDLVTKKGIGKSEFDRIIKATGIHKDFDQIWSSIEIELLQEKRSFQERKSIKQKWRELEIERMNPNNDILAKVIGQVQYQISNAVKNGEFHEMSIGQCMDITFFRTRDSHEVLKTYNEYFVKAIILSELYEWQW